MKFLLGVAFLAAINKRVFGDGFPAGVSCQISFDDELYSGVCVPENDVDYTVPFIKAPECSQLSSKAWCSIPRIPCRYQPGLIPGLDPVCMNLQSSCSDANIMKYYGLSTLCPDDLWCCYGKIVGRNPTPTFPGSSSTRTPPTGSLTTLTLASVTATIPYPHVRAAHDVSRQRHKMQAAEHAAAKVSAHQAATKVDASFPNPSL